MILTPLALAFGFAVPTPASTAPDGFAQMPGPDDPTLFAAPAQTPTRPTEDTDGWDGSLNVGASKSEGNTDVENYTATAEAVKEVDIHRYTLFGGWYYSATDGVRTQRRGIASVKYDQFFAEKTYFWLNTFGETNEQAMVDLRWSIGAGLGHQFRDDEDWSISAEAGLAYFSEEFDNGLEDDYLAARGAWKVRFNVTEQTTFNHSGEIFPSLENSDDVYGRADTSFDVAVSERMNARAQWIYTWDNTPVAGSERADNLYLLSIGWLF